MPTTSISVFLLGVAMLSCSQQSRHDRLCPDPVSTPTVHANTEPRDAHIENNPHFEEVVLVDSIPGKIGHHAATITAFPDGELLAAWYSYTGPDELNGAAIYMARRLSGERAWGKPMLHIDRPQADGNPVLYSEGNNVWLFQAVVPFGWSTAHIVFQRSRDRGKTWTPAKSIKGPLGANVKYPPIRTAEGRLLLPAYDDLIPRSLFFESNDGNEWRLLSVLSTKAPYHAIQPSVSRLSDGRLLAVMRNTGQQWLWMASSRDNGYTWTPTSDSGFPNPASAAALLRLDNGHLILLFNDSKTQRRPLSVAISRDEGQTWTPAKILADGESNYSYPSVVQSADGLIHVVYTVGRKTLRHAMFSEAWITGTDFPDTGKVQEKGTRK